MHRRHVLRAISGAALAAPLAGAGLLAGRPARADVIPDTSRADLLQQLLEAEHAAGMTGAIMQVRDGDTVDDFAVGVADVDTDEPMRPWLRQRIGGASKSFVGVVVLQLVGEGLIDLDASIGRYLPDLLPGERGQQITVRMLLNQTSGIAEYMNLLFATPEGMLDTATRTFQPIELAHLGLALPPVGVPGQRWSYAHTNYVILGLLVERVTGNRYADEVTRRVFKPLDLHDTYLPVDDTAAHIRGPHMAAYIPWTDGSLRDFSVYNMSWGWAACDITSSLHDMNAFYRGLFGGALLDPGLLREMKTTVPFDPRFPQGAGYGLGVYWTLGPCGRTWGHNGLVIGQTVYSAHAEDGHTLQYTQMENLNFYGDQFHPGSHPIDIARFRLQAAVLSTCLGSPAVAAAQAAANPAATPAIVWPPIPDVTLPVW
jgi:D-alanyl-D-alanine carboxypeptidase